MHTYSRWSVTCLALILLSLPGAAMAQPQPNPTQVSRDKSSNLFNIGDADVKPVPLERAAPVYSRKLRAAGVKGDVEVEFIIGLKGEVVAAQIVSSDDSRLNDACLAAVKKWKFKPAKHRGMVVNCRVSQRLTFALPRPPEPPEKPAS